ncbi:MAG: cytidine deaminase [bacterium]
MCREMEKILIDQALKARRRAHAPFSHFKVGAALCCKGGRIYTGCNIENPSMSLSICAERTAMIKAISEGEMDFEIMAIVADSRSLTYPCGACRQMIWEFGPDLQLILANTKGDIKHVALRDLLPEAFEFHPRETGLSQAEISGRKPDQGKIAG